MGMHALGKFARLATVLLAFLAAGVSVATASERDWLVDAVQAVVRQFRQEVILGQALVEVQVAEREHGADSVDVVQALSFQAAHLRECGRPVAAKGCLERAERIATRLLAKAERESGPESEEVADALGVLAELCKSQGCHERARTLLARRLSIKEELLAQIEREPGPDHARLLKALDGLADLTCGHYLKYEAALKRSLEARLNVLGSEHVEVADTLLALGRHYGFNDRPAMAEHLFGRALSIREKALGSDRPEVADVLEAMAFVYRTCDGYSSAEDLLKRSLAIREKHPGDNQQDLLRVLDELADAQYSQGKYEVAETHWRRGLLVREKVFGPVHTEVATALGHLAFLKRVQEEPAAARELGERAVGIMKELIAREEAGGTVTWKLRSLVRSLGWVMSVSEVEDPLPQELKEANLCQQIYGTDNEEFAATLGGIANSHSREGREDAGPLYDRQIETLRRAGGPLSPDLAQALEYKAWHLRGIGRFADAELCYRECLKILEQELGTDHPALTEKMLDYAKIFRFMGQVDQERDLTARALAIRRAVLAEAERLLGAEHPIVTHELNQTAAALSAAGDTEAADELFERAITIRRKVLLGLGENPINHQDIWRAVWNQRRARNDHFKADEDLLRASLLRSRDQSETPAHINEPED